MRAAECDSGWLVTGFLVRAAVGVAAPNGSRFVRFDSRGWSSNGERRQVRAGHVPMRFSRSSNPQRVEVRSIRFAGLELKRTTAAVESRACADALQSAGWPQRVKARHTTRRLIVVATKATHLPKAVQRCRARRPPHGVPIAPGRISSTNVRVPDRVVRRGRCVWNVGGRCGGWVPRGANEMDLVGLNLEQFPVIMPESAPSVLPSCFESRKSTLSYTVNPTSVRPPPFCTAGTPLRSYLLRVIIRVLSTTATLQAPCPVALTVSSVAWCTTRIALS